MHRFFIPSSAREDKLIRIAGQDAHHIRNVLRLKPGEEISVIEEGNENEELRCGILPGSGEEVLAELYFIRPLNAELPIRITLCQGLPKGDKMDLVIQKSVELGVNRIIPLRCERSVASWAGKEEKKLERCRKIVRSAAEQSGRGIIPEVLSPMGMKEALTECAGTRILFPYELAEGMERTRNLLCSIKAGEDVSIFIGPEGGFSAAEAGLAEKAGASLITLGKRILRTETAALYLLSVLGFLFENGSENPALPD